jgi:hypothetical protein
MDAMDGEPVWLCSVSHYDKHGIIGTAKWTPNDYSMAHRLAHSALAGVGDFARERAFRMNITFCVHRAVSQEEKAKLPASWDCATGGMAGGPVEVLWSRGIEHKPAAMPCKNPKRVAIEPSRPDLWIPHDCGECEPCLARKAIAEKIGFNEPVAK